MGQKCVSLQPQLMQLMQNNSGLRVNQTRYVRSNPIHNADIGNGLHVEKLGQKSAALSFTTISWLTFAVTAGLRSALNKFFYFFFTRKALNIGFCGLFNIIVIVRIAL